jgi:hypothetical protein
MNITPKAPLLALVLFVATPMAIGCGGSKVPAGTGVQSGGAGATGTTTAAGGQTATGASIAGSPAGGAAGTSLNSGGAATGGLSGTGGRGGQDAGPPDANTQTGGTTATGGTSRAGGTPATGGTLAAGGTVAAGGTTSAGGSTRTGGTNSPGGTTRTGGTPAAGGTTETGGSPATGGSTAAGGSTADGGVATTGWGTIHNDFFWYDVDGNLISVRSGALRKFGDLYYWYGGASASRSHSCYSSTDLIHWTYKGDVLPTTVGANRIDVLYNATTKQYVMFLKYNGDSAYLGIATASTPDGQFTFLSQTLVDNYTIGDMSMYQDDDGQAYLAYVWWETGPNREHGIYRMSADYLTLDTRMYLWNIPSREAPHIFKRNGTYYYGVSETNGIKPSPTRYYTATNLAGPWSAPTMLNTPGSSTTYETQCDFVLPFAGAQGTFYLFDADRWIPTGGFQGGYLWLPLEFDAAGAPTANYYQDWDFNLAAGTWRSFDRATRDLALGKTATASSESGANVAAGVTKSTTYQNYTDTRWESAASDPQWIMVDLGSAVEIDRVVLKWYTDYGKAFKIQVSTDSTTWTDVYSTTTGASYSVTDVTFAKTTARYVRMSGTQRGNANGYSLFAFMVLNDS